MADIEDRVDRRLRRLHDELIDEGVPLALEGSGGFRLLAEMTYARRPPFHEHRMPRYGALVFDGVPDWDRSPQVPLLVPTGGASIEALRRFADGRSSFTVSTPRGISGLATFEHGVEAELSAVGLQRTGSTVVQRDDQGLVRVCAPGGVVLWNGSRWLVKPRAEDYVRIVARLVPHGDRSVLAGLLDFAVHSLSAERVGATMVWNVDARPPDDRRGGLAEIAQATRYPLLSVVRRPHFPALVSALSQVDLATVVAADGAVGPAGVRLQHTVRAGGLVAALGGARHTSARRFSFDVPSVLIVVVASSGRVTVLSGGAVVAEIALDQQERERAEDMAKASPSEDTWVWRCDCCAKPLLIDRRPGLRSTRGLSCPVCSAPLRGVSDGIHIVGVPVMAPSAGQDCEKT